MSQFFSFFSFFLISFPLFSTTVIPHIHLGEAAGFSQVVVTARVEYLKETLENGTTHFDSHLKIQEVLKGAMHPDQEITVRSLSNKVGNLFFDVAGDFTPEVGRTYLLLLEQYGQVWRTKMLTYYVFEAQDQKGESFWVPLSAITEGVETVERPDGKKAEALCVYKYKELLVSLRNYLSISPAVWDATHAKADNWDPGALDRALPTGCDFQIGSSPNSRWVNPSYSMYYSSTDVLPGWESNYLAAVNAINANYNLGLVNGGSTAFVPNCIGGNAAGSSAGNNFVSTVNSLNGTQSGLIIFNDPCNQLGNITNCSGVLAAGGSYRSTSTHTFDGQVWYDALWAFVIINDGITCMNSTNFQLVLAHEFTHTYRMDHLDASAYPGQNMNPFCCNNIGIKDRGCMEYAYNNAPAPVDLIAFDVQKIEKEQVKLSWETATEKNNDFYTLERSLDGIRFAPLTKIPAAKITRNAQYQWVDQRPSDDLNYYRLSQTDKDGTTKILGVRSVRIEGSVNTVKIFPNPIVSDDIQIRTNFAEYFDGNIEVINSEGKQMAFASLQINKGVQITQQQFENLPSGIYFMHLSDARFNSVQRFVKH